jgi:hypothetical protein
VIKVMVVLYGLVMFVPQDGGLTVLFVDGGSHVPAGKHTPTVAAVLENGELGAPLALEDGFEIAIQGPDGKVDSKAQMHFATLEKLFAHPKRDRVRQDCLRNQPSCRKGDDDLVLGWARIEGAWSTHPATFCNGCGWSLPIGFDDKAQFQFRRRANGPPRDEGTFPLATALRLDTVVKEDALEKLLSLDPQIAAIKGQACEDWIGEDVGQCVVLVIGNEPEPDPGSHGPHLLDQHFSAFYRVALDPPMQINRWLPYINKHSCCPGQPAALSPASIAEVVNRPAPLCPPVYATAAEP